MQLILVHSAIEETVVLFSDFAGRGFFGNFENMTLLHIHQCTSHGNMRLTGQNQND